MFDINDHQCGTNRAEISIRFTCWHAVLCLFTVILAGMVIATQAHADEIVDLQLRWHHQFQFAGYYAALEKGFYKEEGLNLIALHLFILCCCCKRADMIEKVSHFPQ